MPAAKRASLRHKYVWVIKTEEKGSDVNLAAHVINDGYKGLYEVAVIVSNDSDLVEPIRIVRSELSLPVIVLNPCLDTPSHELRKYATFIKPIRTGVLSASQFPPKLKDATGEFHRPPSW
jgi:hypothetical protein